jgi:hypothetical protein
MTPGQAARAGLEKLCQPSYRYQKVGMVLMDPFSPVTSSSLHYTHAARS